jgi:hypothetical protein
MKFKIRVSKSMASHTSVLGSIEDRLIRMSLQMRDKFGLQPGLFLSLKGKDGKSVNLQVSSSYMGDIAADDNSAYISRDTYRLLDLEKISSIKAADDVLIGCDPEFFLIDRSTGLNMSASHFFAHWGDVGNDCGLAELRPRPSTREKEVVATLDELMHKAYYHVKNRALYRNKPIGLIGSSYHSNAAAGFHIHFGLPQSLLIGNHITQNIIRHMVYVLDYYIGIMSILPEGSEDSMRRSLRFSRYGQPSDYRADTMTLEYRVPGGHLLRHPLLASGILALSVVVMKDMLSRFKVYHDQKGRLSKYEDLRNLYPSLPDHKEVYRCITSEDINPALNHTGRMIEDVTKMFGYEENSESILSYFNYIMDFAAGKRKISDNIETNWRLSDERQQREMAFLQASL